MRENIFLKGISIGDGEVIGDNISAGMLYEAITTPYTMTFKEMQLFISESYNQLDSQIITEATILNEGGVIDKLKAIWKAIIDWFKKIYGKISSFIKGLFKKKVEDSGKPAKAGGGDNSSSNDSKNDSSPEPDVSPSNNDEDDSPAQSDDTDTKFAKGADNTNAPKRISGPKGPLAIDSKVSIRYMEIDLHDDMNKCGYPGPVLPIDKRNIDDSSKILDLYESTMEGKGFITKYFVNKYKLKGYYQSIESVIKGINNISDSFTATYNLSEIGPRSQARRLLIQTLNKRMNAIKEDLDHKGDYDLKAEMPDVIDDDLAKKVNVIFNGYKEYNMIYFKVITEASRQVNAAINDAMKCNLIA